MSLGFYEVGGVKFANKIPALLHAQQSGQKPVWNFGNEAFSKVLWHIEPEEPLDSLYDRRAKQIREEYDYVILSYSGGSDSNNILESFLRQGLFIDEVVSNWALDITESFLDLTGKNRLSSNNNAEFKLHTASRLDYIRQASPNTKITVNDTSKALVEGLRMDACWTDNRNDVLNVTGVTNYNLPYFSSIRKEFDRGKKIAFVIGTDKPLLVFSGQELYLCFADKNANMVYTDEHFSDYPNAKPILFYWSPEAEAILRKQAHIMLKVFRNNAKLVEAWKDPRPSVRRLVHEEVLKTIIYSSTWKASYWQVQKTTADWDSELDYWFTRGWVGTPEHTFWQQSLSDLAKRIPDFIAYRDGKIHGIEAMISPYYHIGSLK